MGAVRRVLVNPIWMDLAPAVGMRAGVERRRTGDAQEAVEFGVVRKSDHNAGEHL